MLENFGLLLQFRFARRKLIRAEDVGEDIRILLAGELPRTVGRHGNANALEKIAEGMWNKSLSEVVLLNQPSIRPEDDGKTIETLRAELSGTIGENIEIKRFARFEVGEE